MKDRILSLDLLRGYFLCVIIVDHLARFPNLFDIVTGRGQLWVSAAEGFFLISGILIGVLKPKAQKLYSRAVRLYLCSIGLTLLFTAWGYWLPSDNIIAGIWTGDSLSLVLNTLSLRYVYGWADFLPYYVIFLLVSPLAIKIITKYGAVLLLTASFGVWLIRGQNIYMAWQLIFISGLMGGFY